MKIREEFPFLYQPDCPPELKILVADKITAFENYRTAHNRLQSAFDNGFSDDLFEINRDVIENYLENRQIWEELNHYKEKGSLLGKHKVFSYLNRVDEIRRMNMGQLFKLKLALENNIIRNRKNIRLDPNAEETSARQKRITRMQNELSEVKRILNI